MKNSILLSLAFSGVDRNVLVENILSMCPSPRIAERMLGGIQLPSIEKVQEKYPDRTITSVSMENGFSEDGMIIRYTSKRTVYLNEDPGFGDAVVTSKEFHSFYNKSSVRSNSVESDSYPYKVTYLEESYFYDAPENFL